MAAAAAVAAVAWGGCSAERRYEVLSFFFDGVPDPNAPAEAVVDRARGPGAALAVLSAHSAYSERRCQACHGETARFGFSAVGFEALDETTCRTCHDPTESVPDASRLHGPVAAGACLWCHEAHESPQPHLLVSPAATLCLTCHGFELRQAPEPGVHEDLERDCLDCHLGHGGTEPALLRPDWPRTPPPPRGTDGEEAAGARAP